MRTSTRVVSICAVLGLFASSCGDDPPQPDASEPDSGIADNGAAEAGHPDVDLPDNGRADGGEPPESGVLYNAVSCRPCSACDPSECLTNPNTNESFCSDRCDQNTTACVTGFNCLNIGDEMNPAFYCISPMAGCRGNAIGLGSACYEDPSSCLFKNEHCEADAFALGYCTAVCETNRDCPFGWSCAEADNQALVCKPNFVTDEESCAHVVGDTSEIPCAVDEDCEPFYARAECVRSEPTFSGVCAPPCEDEACGSGSCKTTLRGQNCLSDRCDCHAMPVPEGTRDLLGEALSAAGITRCSTIFRIFDWSLVPMDIRFDPYRLSFFDRVHGSPLDAPAWAKLAVDTIDAANDPNGTIVFAGARKLEKLAEFADRPVTHRMPEMIDPINPLASAVASLIGEAGGVADVAALRMDAMDVPMDLQLAVAMVVEAVERADVARKEALAMNPTTLTQLYEYGPAFVVPRSDGFGLAPANAGTMRLLNDQFQYGAMYGGASDLLDAIDEADLSRFAVVPTATVATSTAVFLFVAETPIGRIAIGNGEPGLYNSTWPGFDGAWALLIDLGGADDYRVPVAGNISPANSVSVMIDLQGDDRYGYVEVPDPVLDGMRLPSDEGGRYTPRGTPMQDNGPISLSQIPRQGGARVGTAILVDLGDGRDRYRSLRMSQGSGIFGAGVLIDEAGDDLYEAEAMSQGAGSFGIGLLLDGSGDDERRAYTMSQGFAFARASGLLHDDRGNDRYLMDPGDPAVGGDPLYFNGQRPGRANTTLGQGWGFGRRADSTDRAFMSGGLGILIDRSGGDTYRGSVFAQGGGFWFGTGILADEDGDDSYDGLWYAMGAAAHYALGFLLEGGGDDRYGGELPKVNVTIAGGHDYSAVFLIDEAGDDIYQGSRITVGGGNSNGMGFFADNEGNDTYSAEFAYSFGAAGLVGNDVDYEGSPRRRVNVVGIFLDGAGTDTYARMGMPVAGFEDNASWTQIVSMNPVVNAIERGAGVDGTGETSFHARFEP